MPQWPWKKPRGTVDGVAVDEYGRSVLWYHAADGDIAALKADLKAGLPPTAADKDGCSALNVAAQDGRIAALKLLIKAGGDVNLADRHGNGPLWTATAQAAHRDAPEVRFEILALLLAAGADPLARNGADNTPQIWRKHSERVDAAYAAAGVAAP